VRTEVDRCREILTRMSTDGAEPAGEALEDVAAQSIVDAVRRAVSALGELRVQIARGDAETVLRLPRHAVEQALIALVKNAFEASPGTRPVELTVTGAASVRFTVQDHGCGMTPDALRHAGEPFFTTKEPGKGMGRRCWSSRYREPPSSPRHCERRDSAWDEARGADCR